MTNGYKNRHLSVSRLRRYEQCPLAFKLHYIDQHDSEPSVALRFGVLMHAVLERVYRWVLAARYTGPLDETRVLDSYRDEWAKSALSSFATYDEGFGILRAYVRQNPSVDYRRMLAVEQAFRFKVGEFDLVGQIDRVDRIDDDTIEIIDYKTNRVMYTRDEVDRDLQLTVYALAARHLWPWAKNVHLGFYLLRHCVYMSTTRTEEQLDAVRDYIIAVGRQTESAEDYPPRLQPNCAYCDHRQHCPAYAAASAGDVEVVRSSLNDLTAVAQEREQVTSLARILYRRKDELDGVLKARLDQDGTLELAGRHYAMRPVTRTLSYPADRTLRALSEVAGISMTELQDELLAIDKDKLQALVKRLSASMPRAQHRLLKAHLDAVAETSVSARLSVRKAS